MHREHDSDRSSPGTFLRSRTGVALIAFLAIAAFFVLTEHTAHALGAVPYGLLLLCPLLHLFMHGGHRADHRTDGGGSSGKTQGDR